MKGNLLALLLLLCYAISFSQSPAKAEWHLGPSLNRMMMTWEPGGISNTTGYHRSNPIPTLGVLTGLSIVKPIGRFTISLGGEVALTRARFDLTVNDHLLFPYFNPADSSISYFDSEKNGVVHLSFFSVQAPLTLGFYLEESKHNFIQAGIEPSIYFLNKSHYDFNETEHSLIINDDSSRTESYVNTESSEKYDDLTGLFIYSIGFGREFSLEENLFRVTAKFRLGSMYDGYFRHSYESLYLTLAMQL